MSYITPYDTGKISESISVIKNGIVNCYVYSKGSERIIIDTGMSAKVVNKELIKLKINPKSIGHVFLTHNDADHTGGLSIFDHAKLYIGEESKVKNPDNYQFLEDNETVVIGEIQVKTISTPGHRLGHSAFLVDNEFLFTGDAIRLKKDMVQPFLRLLSSDYRKQLESIRKISKLKSISIMFTAHNGFTTNFEKAIENWKD